MKKCASWHDSLLTDWLSRSSQLANCYTLNLELANCLVCSKHTCNSEASILHHSILLDNYDKKKKKKVSAPRVIRNSPQEWVRFVEICRPSHGHSVIKTRAFQIAWRGGEESLVRRMGNFPEGSFLSGDRNLLSSNFNHFNFFQCLKQHSVNIEHQLKLKLAWRVHVYAWG